MIGSKPLLTDSRADSRRIYRWCLYSTPTDVGCIQRSGYLSAGAVEVCRRGQGFRVKCKARIDSWEYQEISMEAGMNSYEGIVSPASRLSATFNM
jgi:hypothetical protein